MPSGIDIIARGLAAKATAQLSSKADLVNGRVPASQLPSYVDEIVEVDTYDDLPEEGELNKIYFVLDTNTIYRWSGSTYVPIDGPSHGKNFQFKPEWNLTGTVEEFLSNVYTDATVIGGESYSGELYSSNLPEGKIRTEALVTVFYDSISKIKIIKLDLFNISDPNYRWSVMYAGTTMSDWKTIPTKTSQLVNDSGFLTSLSTIPASQVVYTKDTTVATTVGGLKAGLLLNGKTVENIIERLVGAYVPPVFTPSSVSSVYTIINKRTGTPGGYLMGDTIELQSVGLTLSKGTDFDGIISGKIMQGNTEKYVLTTAEIEELSTTGSVDIALSDIEYTFPANKTSDSVTYSVDLRYNKKSYDANENVVITQVKFSIGSQTTSASDSQTYPKLYHGSLPADAIINSISPAGVVTYNGDQTRTILRKSTLGATEITTDDDNTMGIFVVDGALQDIKFMTNSDIANWTVEDKLLSYTRENGTTYQKTYKIYTNVIAVGSFTYELS